MIHLVISLIPVPLSEAEIPEAPLVEEVPMVVAPADNTKRIGIFEIIETSEAIIGFIKYHLKSVAYKLFNLEIIKANNIQFPVSISHGEDGLFVFRYLQIIDQLLYISKPLWNSFDNPKSVTHKAFDSSMLSGIIAYEKILDENKKYQSKKVELFLNKLLINRIKTFATLSLFSDNTKDSDIFFMKRKFKNSLKYSLRNRILTKAEIYALIYIHNPSIIKVILSIKNMFVSQ